MLVATKTLPSPATLNFYMGCRMSVIEKCMENMDNPAFDYDEMMDKVYDTITNSRCDIKGYKVHNFKGTNHQLIQKLEVIMSAAYLKFRNNDMLGLDWCIKEVRKELGYCPSPFMSIPFKKNNNPFR